VNVELAGVPCDLVLEIGGLTLGLVELTAGVGALVLGDGEAGFGFGQGGARGTPAVSADPPA
jgi:hypothetical protein